MKKLSKVVLILLVVSMVIAIPVSSVNAQKKGTGLEVEEPEIYVGMNVIDKTNNIGEDLIRSKVELKLRQNDIKVLNELDKNYYLFVGLQIEKSELYTFDVNFVRVVEYTSNSEKYVKFDGAVWNKGGGFGRGEENLINGIENSVDHFINEFYKANDF